MTEDILQRAIADLTAIHTLLTSVSIPGRMASQITTIRPLILLRSLAVVYIPYLALTYAVRIRILLALAGTLLLTWRARWASVLRGALWRSSHIRWATYRAWSALSGQPLPPVPRSPQSHSEAQLASISSSSSLAAPKDKLPEASLRFLFTIYENQRWWMGLDWTAALLPGERPSWCSVSQQPAAPPSAFTLPAATTAYTPTADGKGRVKRVARWRWEEEEWRVVVRKDGAAGASRVERPVPQMKDESAAAAGASRILKKMRAGSLDLGERAGGEKEKEGEKEKDVVPDAIGRETCPICIVDFEEGDDLRVLPCEGHHRFHQECVDQWLLELSSSCPLCRQGTLSSAFPFISACVWEGEDER